MANWTTATLYDRAEKFVADYNAEFGEEHGVLYNDSTIEDLFDGMERMIVMEARKGKSRKAKELKSESITPEIPGQVSVDDALADELGLS